jgi:hypothetical protein
MLRLSEGHETSRNSCNLYVPFTIAEPTAKISCGYDIGKGVVLNPHFQLNCRVTIYRWIIYKLRDKRF